MIYLYFILFVINLIFYLPVFIMIITMVQLSISTPKVSYLSSTNIYFIVLFFFLMWNTLCLYCFIFKVQIIESNLGYEYVIR